MADPAAVATEHAPAGNRPRPLLLLLAAAAAGILLDRFFSLPIACWLALAAGGLGAWYPLWRGRRWQTGAAALLLATAGLGAGWHHAWWCLYAVDELSRGATGQPQPVCLEAVAASAPRRLAPPPRDPLCNIPLDERSELPLRVTRVRDGAGWRPASGDATLLVDGLLPRIAAGDRLQVFATFVRPATARNPGEFDFNWYRRAQRQLIMLRSRHVESVTVLERGASWQPRRLLGAVRGHCRRQLEHYLGGGEADLAAAVLLGLREEVPEALNEQFMTTGTIHLLSISGLHVGILAYGFWWVMRLLAVERRTAVLCAAGFVILYATLTEARPPVVRAAILVVAFCLAQLAGRRGSSFNSLAAAALFVLGMNPTNLFQVGTQLSFLSVAVLARFGSFLLRPPTADPLERLVAAAQPWYRRAGRHAWASVGHVFALSGLVWLSTLPLVMYHFHVCSPIAVPLNPLLCLPMAASLFAGFGVLLFGSWLPPLAAACGWLGGFSLAVLQRIIQWAQQLPGGYAWTPAPPAWWVAGCYVLLLAALLIPRRRLPRRWTVALLAAWAAVGAVWPLAEANSRRGRLTCGFVAVGHGSCTVIELPDGRVLMGDAGAMGLPAAGVRAISAYLWSRGITHLDAVVLSHPDTDHYNALPGLLGRFSAGAVYVPASMFREDSEALAALRRALDEHGVPVRTLHAGQCLKVPPPTAIEVLHPPEGYAAGGDNAHSLVLCIDHQRARILLPGDLESPGLETLLAQDPLPADVVLAPHHGSNVAAQAAFAQWARPRWVVVSGDLQTNIAALAPAYACSPDRILHTARQGAVRVTIHDQQIFVTTYRQPP